MRPTVGHQHVREYRYAVTAISPADGRLSAHIIRGGVDHRVMNDFLVETCRRFPHRYCLMFLDGAGAHISHDLVVPPQMHLEFLPPYSPELNPVEALWDYVRQHYFANRVFATIRGVEARLCKAFRDLDARPDIIQPLANFEWIKAAKLTWD